MTTAPVAEAPSPSTEAKPTGTPPTSAKPASATSTSAKSTSAKPAPATSAKPLPPTPAAKPAPAAPPKPDAAAPTLDLDGLKARLKQTKAIGLMTKLSLKNQVDDLLDEFRDHHAGKPPTEAELRRSYDLLMMKVLSLLQDQDRQLASDILASRERIWELLANPKTFAALQA